jgi:uncharacterized protein DUF4255
MSNYLAIATATSVFSQKIYRALNKVKDLSAAPVVTNKRPEKQDGQTVGAYLYLYNVEFNNTLRNNDLATRRADGSLIQQPQVALNLKYHVSFYGRENTLEAQRMMGATIVDLHAEPLITPAEIKQYLDAVGPDGVLSDSDLHQQRASIKIEPVILSLEDISKMWTTFFQVPHEHSLNYEVSVILMESDLNIEKRLPAKTFSTLPDPGGVTEIEKITPPYFEYPLEKQVIEIACKSAGSSSQVRFEEAGVTVAPLSISTNLLKVEVPAQVYAGLNNITIVKQRRENGISSVTRSEPSRIIVQPVISNISYKSGLAVAGDSTPVIQLDINPLPRIDQPLMLWLNSILGESNHDYRFKGPLMYQVDTSAEALNSADFDSLNASLSKTGFNLSNRTSVQEEVKATVWVLNDQGDFFSIRVIDGNFVFFYGFDKSPAPTQVSFVVRNIVPASYLVRVQVDEQQFAESLLIQKSKPSDADYGKYIGPRVLVS